MAVDVHLENLKDLDIQIFAVFDGERLTPHPPAEILSACLDSEPSASPVWIPRTGHNGARTSEFCKKSLVTELLSRLPAAPLPQESATMPFKVQPKAPVFVILCRSFLPFLLHPTFQLPPPVMFLAGTHCLPCCRIT